MKDYPIKAFPYEESYMNHGMDLRDYFAAQAPEVPLLFPRKEWSETIIATSHLNGEKRYTPTNTTKTENWLDHIVRWSYVWADAMMEARK
jgi:hypothetical protein